ncbi:hypothetical protein ACFPM3_00060 [Streptomyces coeruleoprunus]|uniref:Uncharacterized protein n=1 Tax=Streptomyces coeruleoprunus TaxID=285563 RepID=A0ABV9X9J3_9ACTN
MEPPTEVRLIHSGGAEGKDCVLITDGGGPLTRLADGVEAGLLRAAAHTLARARSLFPYADRDELRDLAECLADSLEDALRVAEGRRGS